MGEEPPELHCAKLDDKLVILDDDGYEVTSWSKDEWEDSTVEIINAVDLVETDPEDLIDKFYGKPWEQVTAERGSPKWQSPNASKDDPLQMSVRITDSPEFTFEYSEIGDLDVAVEQAKVQAVSALIHSIDDVEFEMDFSNGVKHGDKSRKAKSPSMD